MEQYCEKKSFSRIGLAMFVYIALTTAIQIGEGMLLPVLFPGTQFGSYTKYALLLLPQYVIAMPAAYLIMKRLPVGILTKKSLGTGRFFMVLFVCFFILYAGNLAGAIVTKLISAITHKQMTDLTAKILSGSNVWANLLAVSITAPIVEELFYRRLLITKLSQYGERTAVIISGLIFGLVHGNLSQFFYAFGLGLGLGYIYVKTGKLRYTIALHIIINVTGGVVSPLIMNNASAFMPVYSTIFLGLAIAGLVVYFSNRKRISFEQGSCEPVNWKRSAFLNAGMIMFFAACAVLFIFNTIAALKV